MSHATAKRGFIAEYRQTLEATGPAGRRFLLGAAFYLVRTLGFSVAFPLFAKASGYSPGEIGLFIAAQQFSLFFFGIPVTMVGSRGHARKLLTIGPVIGAIGIAGLVLLPAGSTLAMIVFALLAGGGGATFWVLGDPLLVATTPPADRTRVFALKFLLLNLGIVLGGGLGGWIPGALEFAGATTLAALTVTMVFFAANDVVQVWIFSTIPAYEEHDRKPAAPEDSGGVSLRHSTAPWAIMFALAVPELGLALGHNGIRPFMSLFFTDAKGLSASATGTVLAILGVLAAIGTLFAPRIAARLGSIPAIAILRAIGGIAVMLCFTGLGLPAVIGMMGIYYFAIDGTEALLIAEAMNRVAPASRTTFSGIYAMAWSLAATAASLLSGLIQDRQDGAFGLAFAISAVGYFFSVIWLVAVFRRLPVVHTGETLPPVHPNPEPA